MTAVPPVGRANLSSVIRVPLQVDCSMGRSNKRKKAKGNKDNIRRVISAIVAETYPGCVAVFSGHAQTSRLGRSSVSFGFRIRDENGKYRSNIVWVDPEYTGDWNATWVIEAVKMSNG